MHIHLILFLSVLFVCHTAMAADIVQPTGIYSSHVGRDVGTYINEPHIEGALVRVKWSEIEAKEGHFDFSRIEQQRRPVIDAGKNWSLAVLAGPSAPDWLMNKTDQHMTIQFRRETKTIVPFWNDTYQAHAQKLAQALAQKYETDPKLVLVYVPQQTANGIEGHFNGTPIAHLKKQGMNAEHWLKAAKSSIRAYSQAFPNKAIAFELHDLLGRTDIPVEIIRHIQREHKGQVGIGVWWLSGKWSYQGNLLHHIAESRLPVYAQVIGKSSQPRRFPNGDYLQVFKQAKDIGAHYIEVWNYELERHVPEKITNAIKSF